MESDSDRYQMPPDSGRQRRLEERERWAGAAANAIFTQTLEGVQRQKVYEAAQLDLPTRGFDLASLSPGEVVNLGRSVTTVSSSADTDTWAQDTTDVRDRLDWTLDHLPALDRLRGAAILTAFADSPLPADRATAARDGLVVLTQFDQGAGLTLWDRLMRDTDKTVRDAGLDLLDRQLAEYRMRPSPRSLPRKGSGWFALDRVDEKRLRVNTGMSKEDARSLLEAYAHAENGTDIHDLGTVALGKLAPPPSNA